MSSWNSVLGHLLSLSLVLKNLLKDSQQSYAFGELLKNFVKSDFLFYLDLWSFSNLLIVVCFSNLSIQACQQHDLSKSHVLDTFFRSLTGGDNLFIMNGIEWKRSRTLFNTGFNANYLLGQISHIIQSISVYVEILRENALKGNVFFLDDVTLWFIMDVIGAVIL
jgi:cytochrome P450